MTIVPRSEDTFNRHRNIFHSERLGTFLEAKWPATQTFLHLCSPQKLAQAGLEYHAIGEGRCVVCFCIVKDLEPTSDPWICHANVNPDCPLILMGKPGKPDDYTLKQFLELVTQRRRNYAELKLQEHKVQAAKRISEVVREDSQEMALEGNGVAHGYVNNAVNLNKVHLLPDSD